MPKWHILGLLTSLAAAGDTQARDHGDAMYFIILATDKPNATQIRQQARPAHLDYIAGFGTQIVAAGATLSDDGTAMTGSFILVDMPDRGAVEEYVRNDPYVKAGLFERVEIRRWRKVIFHPPAE